MSYSTTLSWATIEKAKANGIIEVKECDAPSGEYSKFILTKLVKDSNINTVEDNLDLHWYRSIVWDKDGHFPVAISPRKSDSTPTFKCVPEQNYYLDNFVEGTMINVFALANDPTTYLATRSSLGATGHYFSNKSFKTLFDDAWTEKYNSFLHNPFSDEDLVSRFMSVVLRHPENRFVEKIERPEIVVIMWGECNRNGTVKLYYSDDEGVLDYPKEFEEPVENTVPTVESIQAFLKKESDERGPLWQGLMLSDSYGRRWKFVNTSYSRLRRLRTEARQDVRVFWLLKEDVSVVSDYLKYFPDDLDAYLKMSADMKLITANLHMSYVDLHIKKNMKVEDLKDYFRPHVYGLHGIYLNILKPKGFILRQKEVVDYLNKQPWQRVLFLISRLRAERNGTAGSLGH